MMNTDVIYKHFMDHLWVFGYCTKFETPILVTVIKKDLSKLGKNDYVHEDTMQKQKRLKGKYKK